ncbi:MAG TPA: SpoIIE family protein phosphatase [Candidatus Hydrogenedentes bacterium]|jgi:serine/threonine protein phosphatase PrpC|nr:MAG: Stage II sporulation protein E (SpoIIE) [Candidatus Hydrogenedentes bacterium ADurb.Bin170]HNZ47647.1 SpoIIE family protein phosphatase [Candidatus Hydrogenedentota bacterium]HOD96043.1 SpoIIE family protein phosphatase [Candidatus Hydrogenedentota bacterium]HOM48018.1 SpoIIE family protein phosphatase [Candidatus Hydrogenedentota bacterium]HOR51537.1 SpoIIE family protein phosphatase [Candidatus Hydrogenedentota bacterium]
MNQDTLFLEVDFAQRRKHTEHICGDAFQSQRVDGSDRILAVLSDGLGSGVKANILATMTASMALKFAASSMDFVHSAEVIMDALPVCQIRRISYSTFTIIDCSAGGRARFIEMDNPPLLFIRDGKALPLERREMVSPKWQDRVLRFSDMETMPEDRVVLVSDGIVQAGLGSKALPLGWRDQGLREFVLDRIRQDPVVSARTLAEDVLREALSRELNRQAHDDMSCAVLYLRKPRKMIVLTGPPFDPNHDAEFARRLQEFDGRKVICGGTTTTIVARELGVEAKLDLSRMSEHIPPQSTMEGVDLITEGILTLTRTAQLLEKGAGVRGDDPAEKLAALLLESDIIHFIVGSRINEAHQDPTLPIDLEIRRNIVKRLTHCLEERYLKETHTLCI